MEGGGGLEPKPRRRPGRGRWTGSSTTFNIKDDVGEGATKEADDDQPMNNERPVEQRHDGPLNLLLLLLGPMVVKQENEGGKSNGHTHSLSLSLSVA